MKKVSLIACALVIAFSGCNHKQVQNADTEKNDTLLFESQEDFPGQNWQRYCNERFRFEIQYPQDWMNDIHGNSPANGTGYQFAALPKNREPERRSYFRIFTDNKDLPTNNPEVKEKEGIDFLGRKATSYIFKDGDRVVVFEKDGVFFRLGMNDITTENEEVLEGILSSFRFLAESEICQETNKPGTVVVGDEIYYYGEKIGSFDNGKIFISFQGSTYSFQGDPQYLSKYPMIDAFKGVYFYKDISINLPNENREERKILYECSSSLLPSKPYFYCETNGEDCLAQYEFGENYRQFSTGGGFLLKWKKIYIKNINGEDVVFEGYLTGDSYDIAESPTLGQEEIGRIKSKKHLDEIKGDKANQKKVEEWDQLVKSFSIKK